MPVRIRDWREVYPPAGEELIRDQATRCMDCGIPFCHEGCPLGNRIPDWNDLVRTGAWEAAAESLHATNNFPEFTGRLCPAPCEAACVLGIADDPVTIKQVEVEIANHAFDLGYVQPQPAPTPSGKRSRWSAPARPAWPPPSSWPGPATRSPSSNATTGSAACCATASPTSRSRSSVVDARLAQMAAEGVVFQTGVDVGIDITADDLRERFDAVLLAAGALAGRDTPDDPGARRSTASTWRWNTWSRPTGSSPACRTPRPIDAAGKHVVIIGGGDTGADCLGVAHRQGAANVIQLDQYPLPPESRAGELHPWPTWPVILRNYPAHEEGGDRVFARRRPGVRRRRRTATSRPSASPRSSSSASTGRAP